MELRKIYSEDCVYENQNYRLYPFENIDDVLFEKICKRYEMIHCDFDRLENTFYVVENIHKDEWYVISSFYIDCGNFDKLEMMMFVANLDNLLIKI